MDDYVKVKTYKRTRTYNNLVEMKWIVKERPTNDERTVIIHFNEDKEADKQDLINFTCMEIEKKRCTFENIIK